MVAQELGIIRFAFQKGRLFMDFDVLSKHLLPNSTRPCDCKTSDGEELKNQCAIRMGIALSKAGLNMRSIPREQECWNATHDPHILRVEWLAKYLGTEQSHVLGKPDKYYSGSDARKKIKGRKGIIAVMDFWTRPDENEQSATGDHIDLWDGECLQNGSVTYLNGAKRILFWELSK